MPAPEIAVVGGGPAGLAAALAATEVGANVTLFDQSPGPGGQYIAGTTKAATRAERASAELLAAALAAPIRFLFQTLVWDLRSDLSLRIYREGRASTFRPQAVVLATGARENAIPFPGWTLPGVCTAGAAQLLIKRHGLAVGRRVVIAGSGPLLPTLASKLLRAGVRVIAVLEATNPSMWLPHAPALMGDGDRLQEGTRYIGDIVRHRVPYRFGWGVVRAAGQPCLESVVAAPLAVSGGQLPGEELELRADALCLSGGFAPNIELARLAGCALFYDAAQGGWVPLVSEGLHTSVAGLFATGETAGVAGAAAAMVSGRLAGLEAARRAGISLQAPQIRELVHLRRERRRTGRFGRAMNSAFTSPADAYARLSPETVVCRCEEVTAGEVYRAIEQGAVTVDAVKTWTRSAQGPCQGRTCGTVIARMIAARTGATVASAGLPGARPPAWPVPMGALAASLETAL